MSSPDPTAPTYRVATLSDAHDIAECMADSMIDDGLFGAIYPRRKENLWYFKTFFKRRARARLCDPTFVTLVAEMPLAIGSDGTSKNTIVGVAQWQKFGAQCEETKWSAVKAVTGFFVSWEDWIRSFFDGEDLTIDQKTLDDFIEDGKIMEERYWMKDCKDVERWHLQFLAVHSKAWRRGIGSKLVQMGIDRARRDGCDAALEASVMGYKMYLKNGFELIEVYEMKMKMFDGTPLPTPILKWTNPELGWIGPNGYEHTRPPPEAVSTK